MRLKIDLKKLNIILARRCESIYSFRDRGFSPQTITKIGKGLPVSTATAGKLAKLLEVDVTEILADECLTDGR